MSISWYECEIMTQIHHFGCRGLSVAMICDQGKICNKSGKSQGKVREKSGNFFFPILWEPCQHSCSNPLF